MSTCSDCGHEPPDHRDDCSVRINADRLWRDRMQARSAPSVSDPQEVVDALIAENMPKATTKTVLGRATSDAQSSPGPFGNGGSSFFEHAAPPTAVVGNGANNPTTLGAEVWTGTVTPSLDALAPAGLPRSNEARPGPETCCWDRIVDPGTPGDPADPSMSYVCTMPKGHPGDVHEHREEFGVLERWMTSEGGEGRFIRDPFADALVSDKAPTETVPLAAHARVIAICNSNDMKVREFPERLRGVSRQRVRDASSDHPRGRVSDEQMGHHDGMLAAADLISDWIREATEPLPAHEDRASAGRYLVHVTKSPGYRTCEQEAAALLRDQLFAEVPRTETAQTETRKWFQHLVEFVRADQCPPESDCVCCRAYLDVANAAAAHVALPTGYGCFKCDGHGKVGDSNPCRVCGGTGRLGSEETGSKEHG